MTTLDNDGEQGFPIAVGIFPGLGLPILWRAAHRNPVWWSGKMLLGTIWPTTLDWRQR